MNSSLERPDEPADETITNASKGGGRRRFLSGCLVLVLAALVGAGYMLWTVQQVPEFYRRAAAQVADTADREAAAVQFKNKIESLQLEAERSAEWTETFSQDEINSWLEQEAQRKPEILPDGVHRPLVVIDHDRFQLGMAVNWQDWKGIISLEAAAVASGPRTIEFRLLHVRLGRLDIAMDEVRRRVKPQIDANESEEYLANWIDTPTGPVIKVELTDADSAHLRLTEISLMQGRVTIRGVNVSSDSSDVSPD